MYIYGAKKPYKDYLIEKSYLQDYENKMEVLINEQTRKLIISNTALQEKNTWAIEKLNKNTNENLEKLFIETNNTNKMISQLNSTIYWGYNYIGELLDKVNYYLDEIVHHLKTPIQTKAYEYYEIASDAFEDKLFPECLKYLEKAIELYNMEWRFYYMKGLIEQGFIGCDTDLIDLDKAEESFLLSARYSMANSSITASTSYLSASWAAYCNGRLNYAKKHLKCAKDKNPDNGEIYYRLAKISADENNEEDAIKNLKIAFVYSVQFCIKAGGDESFNKYKNQVQSIIKELNKEYKDKSIKLAHDLYDVYLEITERTNFPQEVMPQLRSSSISSDFDKLEELISRDSLYDNNLAIKGGLAIKQKLTDIVQQLENEIEKIKTEKKKNFDENNQKEISYLENFKTERRNFLVHDKKDAYLWLIWVVFSFAIPWLITAANLHDFWLLGLVFFLIPYVSQIISLYFSYEFVTNQLSINSDRTSFYIGQAMFFFYFISIVLLILKFIYHKKDISEADNNLKIISNTTINLSQYDELINKLKIITKTLKEI